MSFTEEPNVTTFDTDGTTTDSRSPTWLIAVDRLQLAMTVVGAFVNMATVITLSKISTIGENFSSPAECLGHRQIYRIRLREG